MSLRGARVLITSGPTREYIDPVRYISNASSGAMGFALAEAARRRGARVTVVSGPSSVAPPRGLKVVRVTTAREMLLRTIAASRRSDVVIAAAAVADWRAARPARGKIKRTGPITLRLAPNPDIIASVSRRRKRGARRPVLIGFALETRRGLGNARRKLKTKGLDIIVANRHTAIGSGRTRITVLGKDGRVKRCPAMSKRKAAESILRAVEERL